MSKHKDLSGQTFNKWFVVKLSHSKKVSEKSYEHYYLCECVCGTQKIIRSNSFVYGNSKSCGCGLKKQLAELQYKHGHNTRERGPTVEYKTWIRIKMRCNNPDLRDYKNYGARGIKVCERWADFANFYADMGPRPGVGYSIDRINNDGDYEPGNCRWTDIKTQNRNRKKAVKILDNGKLIPLAQYAEEKNITYWQARTIARKQREGKL